MLVKDLIQKLEKIPQEEHIALRIIDCANNELDIVSDIDDIQEVCGQYYIQGIGCID